MCRAAFHVLFIVTSAESAVSTRQSSKLEMKWGTDSDTLTGAAAAVDHEQVVNDEAKCVSSSFRA